VRIAVVGRSGQLSQCLVERARARGIDIVVAGRPELDLTREASVARGLEAMAPTLVVNAAAMTAVDLAESDAATSVAVNKHGAALVAAAARSLGAPVIHVSTDFVFDGAAGRAYTEDDKPNPISVYGVSKLAGERAVAEANARHLIMRTAWVHSPYGSNFVRAILAKAGQVNELDVVADQWGSPTSGLDLADAILHAAEQLDAGSGPFGTYHVAGSGSTNRSGQAREALAISKRQGGPDAQVRDIRPNAALLRAPRPRNSTLSSEKFARDFGWQMPDWKTSMEDVVVRLVAELQSTSGGNG